MILYGRVGPAQEQAGNYGALMLCPCLFCPSDNVWRSRHADLHRCVQFSTVISPSWITEQISVGKCAHQARQRVRSAKQVSKFSLGQKKHGQNITTPIALFRPS